MRLYEFLSLVENKNKLLDFLLSIEKLFMDICPRCKAAIDLNREHMNDFHMSFYHIMRT